MRWKTLWRAGAWLGACGALVLLTWWLPTPWGSQAKYDVDAPPIAAPANELCGLALTTPQSEANELAEKWLWLQNIPDRVTLRLDVPYAPLAGLGRTVVDATSDRQPAIAQRIASPAPSEAVADVGPAALELPSIPAPTQTEATTSDWQRPPSLVGLLNRLQDYPPAVQWTARVSQAVEMLTSSAPISESERKTILQQLAAAVADVESLIETLDSPQGAALLRRAGYALTRRLDLWQATLAIQEQSATEERTAVEPQRLAECVTEMDQLMQGTAGADWRTYLMMESLNELARSQPDKLTTEQRSLARRVLQRLDHARRLPGRQQFVSQGPLAVLDEQLRLWADEPIDTPLLLARLEQYEQTGHVSLGPQVEEDLRRLAFSPRDEHQALAQKIEEHYRNCNVRVAVSQELVSRCLPAQEPVEAAVRDTILGVPVRGRSTTTNELSLKLLPSSDRLRMELAATGFVQSTTTSQRGSVAFNSRSESTYTAHKVLEFGARQIDAQPAEAEAQTSSRLRSVQSEYDDVPLVGAIVQDLAMDRYRERREAARREVQQKVAAQARQRLDKFAEDGFQRAHQKFMEQVITPLARLDLEPSYVESRTDEKRFTVRARLATPRHLAANTPRPRALSDSLLSAQIHESAVNNVLDRMGLAGRRFTADELRKHLAEKLNRSKPLEPATEDDYAVTFAESDPVLVRLREGRVELTLNIAQLESGSRTWRDFTVQVTYRPQAVGRSVELARDGVISLSGERLGMQSQFVLRGTFGRIFSDERRWDWLTEIIEKDARLAGLQVTQCVIEDGWLGLAIGPQRTGGEVVLGL